MNSRTDVKYNLQHLANRKLFPGIHKICCRDKKIAIFLPLQRVQQNRAVPETDLYRHAHRTIENKTHTRARNRGSRLIHLIWHSAMATRH